MDAGKPDTSLEPLTEIPTELMATSSMQDDQLMDQGGAAGEPAVTHAMITADGQTVPITLNPETGQYTTPDGQTVEVQLASEEDVATFGAPTAGEEMGGEAVDEAIAHPHPQEATETVIPDIPQEPAPEGLETETSPGFQIVTTQPQQIQQQPHQQMIVVKGENLAPAGDVHLQPQQPTTSGGNIQLISADGSVVS